MNNEPNLCRMQFVIRGALDYLTRDSAYINEGPTTQGKVKLIMTMVTIETALLWMRQMVEDALSEEEK